MAIIEASGLFLGDRLAWCSDEAQLHWTRLYAAANNYARLELNYQKIVAKAYVSFKKKPTETQFWAWVKEYRDNFLLFVYQDPNGNLWGQWQTNERYLLGHKNADDKRSPAPPEEAQQIYRNAYLKRKTSKSSENVKLADLLGVVPTCEKLRDLPRVTSAGVGVGGGEGDGEGRTSAGYEPPKDASTADAVTATPPSPPFITFPLLGDKTHIVTEADVALYEQAYPVIDVRHELRRVLPWLDAHPDKRSSTVKGSKQRIVKWLAAEQDKGGRGHGTNQQSTRTNQPAAVERQRITHDAIRAAAARRYGADPEHADGGSAGPIPKPNPPSGDAGHVSGGVGADGAQVWTGDVSGRVIEGNP